MRQRAPGKRDALGKAVELLWWMVGVSDDLKENEWGVREIAQGLCLPPATAHRVLTSLMKHGLIQRSHDSGQYQIGMEFYRLASKVQSSFVLRKAAVPIMQELVAQCNETAFLGLYDPSRMEMMFVAAVHSSHPLRYVVPINDWIPVYAGASGLAIMAFLPEGERRAIIKRTRLVPLTEHTISKPTVLEEEFGRVRARGYAFSRGQRNVGAVAIAAPVWGPGGRVIRDLVLSMPESRYDEEMEPDLARLVIQHAKRIMERLGAQAAPDRRP